MIQPDVSIKKSEMGCPVMLYSWEFLEVELRLSFFYKFVSILMASPQQIFPGISTRANTPSRGMMQSPAW